MSEPAPILTPPTCRACGSPNWEVKRISTTRINVVSDVYAADPIPKEEVRCSGCTRKPNLAQIAAIRQTIVYKSITTGEVESEETE